jgi:FkbM family methyltransferase
MWKSKLKRLAHSLGVYCISKRRFDQLESMDSDIPLLMRLVEKNLPLGVPSKSQLHQDLMVLLATGMKRNGYFVEFGATNGVDFSNSYLLEKGFAWRGILAEPARIWHDALRANRSAEIDFSCVWSKSGESLRFCESRVPELSTIRTFAEEDFHAHARKDAQEYDVETISLIDLLEKHASPREIDYLSIDTEGSEYEILKAFDFQRYRISVITCEHNYGSNRDDIHRLLSSHGFERKMVGMSKFDDWYFHQSLGLGLG